MQQKNFLFSILENIEEKKIEQKKNYIKNLYNQKKNILNK